MTITEIMTTNKLLQTSNRWVLDQINAPLMQIVIGKNLRLDFSQGEEVYHVAFAACHIIGPFTEAVVSINDLKTIPDLLQLINMPILQISAFKTGDLEIQLDEGICLFVTYSEEIEAWELHSSAGKRVVSMPGGQLAVWNPRA